MLGFKLDMWDYVALGAILALVIIGLILNGLCGPAVNGED